MLCFLSFMWKVFVKYPRNVFPSELIIYNVSLNLLWNWFSLSKSIFFWRILWHTAGARGTLWDGPTTPDIPILLESPPWAIRIDCVSNRIHGRDRWLLGYWRHCSKSRGTDSSEVSATFLPWGHFLTTVFRRGPQKISDSINGGSAPSFLGFSQARGPWRWRHTGLSSALVGVAF